MDNSIQPYVFYQTYRSVGFCHRDDWDKYKYDHDINPTITSMLDCSDEYIKELLETFKYDKEEFIQQIKNEIDADIYKIFSS